MADGKKLLSDVYTGAAAVGRGFAYIGAIFATIIGLMIVGYGIWVSFYGEEGEETAGPFIVVGGVTLITISWLIEYFARKSKAFAAVSGVGDVVQMITGK